MRRFLFVSFFTFVTLSSHASNDMVLTSTDIADGATLNQAQVLNEFGCSGGNQSPHLRWSGQPKEARSFAVTVYDPDAPTGSGWWHWVVFNIPRGTQELSVGAGSKTGSALPSGSKQSKTDFGAPGYGGACPPAGAQAHRYVFTVYALNVDTLPVDESASPAMVGYFIHQHKIAQATLTARFQR